MTTILSPLVKPNIGQILGTPMLLLSPTKKITETIASTVLKKEEELFSKIFTCVFFQNVWARVSKRGVDDETRTRQMQSVSEQNKKMHPYSTAVNFNSLRNENKLMSAAKRKLGGPTCMGGKGGIQRS